MVLPDPRVVCEVVSVITIVICGVLINWLTKAVPGVPKVVGSSGSPGDTLVEAGRGGVPNDAIGQRGERGGCPGLISCHAGRGILYRGSPGYGGGAAIPVYWNMY